MRNKRLLKNNGFTLVELLVALAIAALIFAISLPTISILQSTLQDKKFEAYKDVVRSATKLYAKSYKKDIEFNDEGTYTVGLKELIDRNLINDYDNDNITCVAGTSGKIIQTSNKNKYCVTLVCTENGKVVYQGIDSSDYCKTDYKAPSINVKIQDPSNKVLYEKNIESTKYTSIINENLNPNKWYGPTDSKTTLKLVVTVKDDNLSSLSIDGTNYNVEKNKETSISIDYGEHKGVIPIIAKDDNGNSANINLTLNFDKTKPECGDFTGDFDSNNTTKTIYVNCIDNISGCKEEKYSKEVTSTGKTTVSIDIEDKVGNKNTCTKEIELKGDSTPPTCGDWSGESTTWTNKNRTIYVACEDIGGTGCAQDKYSTTVSSEGKIRDITINIYDKAGNMTACKKTANVYIDTTPPTYTGSSKKLNKKENYGAIFYASFSDNLSGLKLLSGKNYQYCYETIACSGYNDRLCKKGWRNATATSSWTEGALYGTVSSGLSTKCCVGKKTKSKYIVCDKAGNCTTDIILNWTWK